MNYQDTNKISLICGNCAHIEEANATVTASLDSNLDILGFEAKIICKCPKCNNGIMMECDPDFVNIVQKLQLKHYFVVDCNSGSWQPGELFAPYIKVLSGGPVKIIEPKGWKDVTGQSVGSFQVFSPLKSYGCADENADPNNYSVEAVFGTEEDFNKAKAHYMSRLDQWADELEINTTIATKKDFKSSDYVIDVQ